MACDEWVRSKGLCVEHHKLARRSLEFREKYNLPRCSVLNCDKLGETKGMCQYHRHLFVIGGHPDDMVVDLGDGFCVAVSCESVSIKNSRLCGKHRKMTLRYRIPIDKLKEILSISKCQVCGRGDNLSIDHDHACCPQNYGTCGQCNRGVLCRGCNMSLGSTKDSPQTLRALADYLESGVRI